MERTVADLGTLIGINVAGRTAEALQFFEDVQTSHHLVNGVRREEVKVDLIHASFGMTAVTLWPFLRIANGANASEVDRRR